MRNLTAAAWAVALGGAAMPSPSAMAQAVPGAPARPFVTHVQTAGELAAICDPAWGGVPRLEAIAYCQGFLTSFGPYHALLYPRGGPARPLFCMPVPGPTVAESGVGFATWAGQNRQHGAEPALDGLLRWAQASFPCAPAAAAPTPSSRRAR